MLRMTYCDSVIHFTPQYTTILAVLLLKQHYLVKYQPVHRLPLASASNPIKQFGFCS